MVEYLKHSEKKNLGNAIQFNSCTEIHVFNRSGSLTRSNTNRIGIDTVGFIHNIAVIVARVKN